MIGVLLNMTAPSDIMTDDLRERFADAPLRIGTRTTPLAKAQTQRVVSSIEQRVPGLAIETVGIETSADLWTGDLSLLGGKGNFTKEIDRALICGKIDIAVHSMKDVPGDVPLPKGTEFGANLPRGDVHDVLRADELAQQIHLQQSELADWQWSQPDHATILLHRDIAERLNHARATHPSALYHEATSVWFAESSAD